MSSAAYRQIETELHGDVYCVRLRDPRLRFTELDELIAELDRFVAENQCRKLVLMLGPDEPQCLYSLFLAKLVSLQRRLQANGGALKLAGASENVVQVFEACKLRNFFDFLPDRDAAIAALAT